MDPPSFAEGKKQLLLVFPGLLVWNISKRNKKMKENFLATEIVALIFYD